MRKLLALMLISTSLYGAKYVSTSGSGSGTIGSPWSFASAMAGAVAGDTVYLRGGSYAAVFAPDNSGTSGSPIVFKAYPGESVTLTGASDGDVAVVYLTGSYVELHGVDIVTGEEPAWDSDYIVAVSGDHNVLRNCRLWKGGNILNAYNDDDYRARGIALSGQYNTVDSNYIRGMNEGIVLHGGSPRYHTIRGNRIGESVWNGIICGGTNDGSSSVMGVLIEGNTIDTCYGEDNIQFQPGTDPYSYNKNRGYIIRDNYLAHGYENCIDLKGAAFVVIEGNVIHTTNGDDDGVVNGAEDWGSGPALERGNPEALNDYFTLYRNNVVYDGAGGVTLSHGGQWVNNVALNNRRRLTTSNYSDSSETGLRHVNIEGSNTYPRTILNSVFVGQPNYSTLYFYNMDNRTSILTLDNNVYYDSAAGTRFYHRKSSGAAAKVYGLSAWQTALGNSDYSYIIGKDANSVDGDPVFVNAPLRPFGYSALWDFSLDTGSPGIDAGRCWTFASGSGSSSTSLVVDNPYLFTDGFGIVLGDSVKVGEADPKRVTAINYSTATLTLSGAVSWSDNDSVWLVVNGSAVNDMGLYSVLASEGGEDPGAAPSTPTQLTPANGSTRTSPVTFSWTRPSGSETFYLCVSPDGWGTLIVDQSALTDTFYTVSLPQGGSYVWNVSASNTYGRSAWSPDWTFITSVASTYRDTVSLSWNLVSHVVEVDTNTFVQFTNLQRRDIMVALRNPNGKEVYWSGVTWLTHQPPTIPPSEAWFQFFRAGSDTVFGSYINESSAGSVTWASIVGNISDNSALTAALARKPDTNDVLQVFNVRAYNAIGDSVTDDLTAIRTAVASAGSEGIVYFPPGTYRLSDSLNLPSGVTLQLDAARVFGTVFNVTGTGASVLGTGPAAYDRSGGSFSLGSLLSGKVRVAGDGFVMRDVAAYNYGDVVVVSSDNTLFVNCLFVGRQSDDPYHSFLVENPASKTQIVNCTAYRNVHGFAIKASDVLMTNCATYDNGYDGLIIKGDTLQNNADISISNFVSDQQNAASSEAVVVQVREGGTLRRVTLTGIHTRFGSNGWDIRNESSDPMAMSSINISGSTSQDATYKAFYLYKANDVAFVGCAAYSSGQGFYADTSNNIRYIGCAADSNSAYGYFNSSACSGMYLSSSVARYNGTASTSDSLSRAWIARDVNGRQMVQGLDIYAPADTGVSNNAQKGNIRLYQYGPRVSGMGPSIQFYPAIGTSGTTTEAFAQAEIIGASDNGSDVDATGQIRLRGKYLNGANWDFKDMLRLRASGVHDMVGDLAPESARTYDLGSNEKPYDSLFVKAVKSDSGYIAPYFASTGNAAVTGVVRVPNNVRGMSFRNAANTKDQAYISINSSNELQLVSNGASPALGLKVSSDASTITIPGYLSVGYTVTADRFRLDGLNTAPSSAGDTGTTGEIRFVDGYIYVCVATNTWKRAAIATWP